MDDEKAAVKEAGAVCYKRNEDEIHFLLIRTLDEDRWIIPKGRIKKDEYNWQAAEREAREEAGAVGTVCKRPLGTFRYSKHGELEAFLLRVREPDKPLMVSEKERDPRWFTLEQARRRLLKNREDEYGRELQRLVQEAASVASKRIFIGHGRSGAWKELRDFLSSKLGLEWDEFNRTSAAGIATKDRLDQMLRNANFAFLVMTAEDEDAGGSMHARENVIHELGLFQGRLGFERAVILMEEGVSQFSNIQGLTYIMFQPGRMQSTFEEVRRTLCREDVGCL